MARARKVITRILLGLLLLALALGTTVWWLVDTAAWKQQLVTLVEKRTGRALTIPGDLRLTLFPALGVETGQVTLGNAPGFGPRPMLEIRRLAVHVKLLPLLRGEIAADTLVLDGLRLRLARNRQGRGNWEDLLASRPAPTGPAQPAPPAAGAPPPAAGALPLLAIAGVEIRDARIDWRDARSGETLHLGPVDLRVGRIAPGQPFPLRARIGIASHDPELRGRLDVNTTLTFQPDASRLDLADLRIQPDLAGKALPGGTLRGRLSSPAIRLELASGRLDSPRLEWQGLGFALLLEQLRVTDLHSRPAYQARLRVPAFAPRQTLSALGLALPPMAGDDALQKAALEARLAGDPKSLSLTRLKLALDASTLEGEIRLPRLAPPAIRYRLRLDRIDADRYLPPPPEKGQATPVTPAAAASGAATGGGLPLKSLRALDVAGELEIGELKLMNLRSQSIRVPFRARQGRLRLAPLSARLYAGTYAGDIRLDVTGPDPHLQLNERLEKVRIGPLLKDYLGDDKLRGTADLAARLSADGLDPLAFRRTLNGTVRFDFRDGAVKGIDIPRMERELRARLKGRSPPPADSGNETAFSRITGSAKIVNGLARNDDLRAALPHARAIGKGVADLVSEKIDYTLYVKFTSEVKGQSGQAYEKIDKPPLPIRFRGPFDRIAIQPDFEALLKALAKREADKKKRELENRAREELEKKARELIKGLRLP